MADKLVQQNFNEIIIDDGSVKVPIRNKHGEQIGEFSFRPTDIGIVDRFNSVAAEFDKIVDQAGRHCGRTERSRIRGTA